MMERTMTVTEAARHFADLLNRTYYRGESTVLVRSGEPVAMVVPVGGSVVTGRDWLTRWRVMPHLEVADADDFAVDIESARENLLPPKSPWD
ncbi:MAG: Antitoxin Phd YefM, type toxin-antitoxin system [Verrucomicrobiota bacterium]|jgi:prevent-host-death family protein